MSLEAYIIKMTMHSQCDIGGVEDVLHPAFQQASEVRPSGIYSS